MRMKLSKDIYLASARGHNRQRPSQGTETKHGGGRGNEALALWTTAWPVLISDLANNMHAPAARE